MMASNNSGGANMGDKTEVAQPGAPPPASAPPPGYYEMQFTGQPMPYSQIPPNMPYYTLPPDGYQASHYAPGRQINEFIYLFIAKVPMYRQLLSDPK